MEPWDPELDPPSHTHTHTQARTYRSEVADVTEKVVDECVVDRSW